MNYHPIFHKEKSGMQKKHKFILLIDTFSKFLADILEALGLSLAGGFNVVSFSIPSRFGIVRTRI